MASTRNRNSIADYQYHMNQSNKMASLFFSEKPEIAFAGFGLNPSTQCAVDEHFCDTESFLLGISSTNLVNPTNYLPPKPIHAPILNIAPKPQLFVPSTYNPPINQREMPRN